MPTKGFEPCEIRPQRLPLAAHRRLTRSQTLDWLAGDGDQEAARPVENFFPESPDLDEMAGASDILPDFIHESNIATKNLCCAAQAAETGAAPERRRADEEPDLRTGGGTRTMPEQAVRRGSDALRRDRRAVMHPEIENRKAEIAGLCGRYGVVRLDVFGSAARGTDFDPERSDADFAVEFRPVEGLDLFGQHMDFLAALRALLGRKVDLIQLHAGSRQSLKEEIERDRELVYEA